MHNLSLISLKLNYFSTIHVHVNSRAALLTCNGAADLAPARTDAGAVPYHPVLGSLVSFTDPVRPVIVLIITGLLD